MKSIFALLILAFGATAAFPAIQTKTVLYKQGEQTLEGILVWDDTQAGKRPGVLVVHQWMGVTDYEKKRAEMLAQLGYVAFVADIYGQGIRPSNPRDAGAEAGKYKKNRALLRQRVQAGLEQLRQAPSVDASKVAAMGYCFGGTTVIELARSGADLAGVISFHGGLDSPTPADGARIKCKVLALHGADDPFVPGADLQAFVEEMRQHKVDWQLVQYGGAVHSFTDWKLKESTMPGAQYNERADRRSWEDLKQFLGELFK
jgi:dienelactone hydrolase